VNSFMALTMVLMEALEASERLIHALHCGRI
jgi:hypothetical protein